MEKEYADSMEPGYLVPDMRRSSGAISVGEIMETIEENVSDQSTLNFADRHTDEDKEEIKDARSYSERRYSDDSSKQRMGNDVEVNRASFRTGRRHSINPILISPKEKKEEEKARNLNKATSGRRHSTPVVQDVGHLMMDNIRRPVELYISLISPLCRAVWIYLLQSNTVRVDDVLCPMSDECKYVCNSVLRHLSKIVAIWCQQKHQIPHIIVEMDYIAEEPKLPDTLKKLPHREVPILIDKDMVVFECTAILSYLAVTYTNHAGFGTSVQQRMVCESLLCWACSNLFRAVSCNYVYPQFIERFSLKSSKANEDLLEQGLKQLTHHLEILEKKYLVSNRYLTGNRVTIADFVVATILVQVEWTGTNFILWPKVSKWFEQMKNQGYWETVHFTHNSVKKTLESKDMLHG